jgi:hypothetical protein
MPSFITIPNPQTYPPTTIPQLAPGIIAYMFGIRNDYRYGVGVVVAEPLVTGNLSLEYSVPSYAGTNSNAPAFQWVLQYPVEPGTVEVHLEGTLDILNGPWFQLAKSTNAAGDSQTVNFGTAKVAAVRTNVVSAANENVLTLTGATYDTNNPYTLTAAGTASAGHTAYTGTFSDGAANALVGQVFTIAGFVAHTANNGTFLCTASTATVLTLANAAGVAETQGATATSQSTIYAGTITGGGSNAFAGATFTITGFVTHTSNNGSFVCTSSSASQLILTNVGVTESHAATATDQATAPTVISTVSI